MTPFYGNVTFRPPSALFLSACPIPLDSFSNDRKALLGPTLIHLEDGFLEPINEVVKISQNGLIEASRLRSSQYLLQQCALVHVAGGKRIGLQPFYRHGQQEPNPHLLA